MQPGRILRWMFYGLLLLGATGYFWLTGHDALGELTDSWEKEKRMEQAIQRLELENQQLETTIKELAPDGQAVERIAREDLGWAKPGEIVVKIPEKE